MAKELVFNYECSDGKDEVIDFFRLLPNVKTRVVKENIIEEGYGEHKGAGPIDLTTVITYAGSAILSSATIAAVIKSWIGSRRRKVVITVGDKRVEYEGPNLKLDTAVIETMIDKLAQDSGSKHLTVTARKK